MRAVDVMIVDDLQPFRAVARTVVRLVPGWRVVCEASSGEEACALAASGRPDVIVMDVHLPGMDGITATRRILEHAPETKIILVSTYGAADLPAEAATCGALVYIRKDELTSSRLRDAV